MLPIGLAYISSMGDYITSESGTRGLYHATFTFTGDTNGDTPSGFSSPAIVNEIYQSHSKIGRLGNGYTETTWHSTPKNEETVEFWFLTTNSQETSWIKIGGDLGDFVRIRIQNGILQTYEYGSGYNTQINVNNNQWYHIKIHWKVSADNYKLYINNVLEDGGCLPVAVMQYTNLIEYGGFQNDSDISYIYFDAYGLIWDSGYTEGENLIEDYEVIYLRDILDISVLDLLTVLIPILAILGIALFYIKSKF